jgi:hypothetical protein
MVYWADTPAGKARAAEREREASEAQARAAIEKEQLKAAQKVKTAKEKASARGQELLFDIELPSTDARAALTADRQREQGHGNGHTTGETTPGAAGDWTAFVERARAAAGTPEAKTGTASAQRAIEELAADLTQGTLF